MLAGRKLKTKAKTNLQNRAHKSHGKSWPVEQLMLSPATACKKSREISLLPVLSRRCDFVGECSRKIRPWLILDRVLSKRALPVEECKRCLQYVRSGNFLFCTRTSPWVSFPLFTRTLFTCLRHLSKSFVRLNVNPH